MSLGAREGPDMVRLKLDSSIPVGFFSRMVRQHDAYRRAADTEMHARSAGLEVQSSARAEVVVGIWHGTGRPGDVIAAAFVEAMGSQPYASGRNRA
jgi:hypothetical protein